MSQGDTATPGAARGPIEGDLSSRPVPTDGGSSMPYAEGRIVHDADAHIMEWPTWLSDYADPAIRDRVPRRTLDDGSGRALDFERVREKHASDEYRAVEAEEIMLRKNFAATGGFIAED